MSELTKNQLKQDNTNSFPNNNTGYITPTILRDFNNNMIDSLVSQPVYTADSASFNSRINDLDPSGSQQSFAAIEAATASLQIATASLNAYTASQNLFNSSATASIVALKNFSSSLDATFATDAQLSASVSSLSGSVAVTTLGLSSSVAQLQQFSSSLDSTYATDSQLSASVSALSASVAVTDLSQSSSIAQLLGFSSSLDATFATDAQLTSLSASIAVTDLSQSSSIAALQSFSSSLDATFATDAQLSASVSSLSSSVAVTDLAQSSSIAQLLGFSSSLDATFATDAQLSASVAGLSSSVAITTNNLDLEINQKLDSSSFNSYTQSNDTKWNNLGAQSGSFITESETGSMSVLSSSFASTASVALTVLGFDSSSLVTSASFNAYTSSNDSKVNSLISKTGSYATTGSNQFNGIQYFQDNVYVASDKILFTNRIQENAGGIIYFSGDLTAVNPVSHTVNANLIGTASFATTASFALNATTTDTSSLVTTSSFNSYTSSQSVISASFDSRINAISTASLVTTSSFNSYTSSNDSKVNALINATGSYITESETSSFAKTDVSNTFSVGQTLQGVLDIQQAGNPSVYTSISQNAADGKLRFGQVGATGFDFVNDVKVSGSVTASNFIGTASYATQALTASFALNVVSVDTSSLVTTSSFNSYTASASTAVSGAINSATQSLSSSIAVTTNGLDLEVNQKLDSASFNSYTQSNDSKVNSLIAATGSYAISSSVATITGLSLVTASISGDTITFTKGNGSTFPIVVPVASGSVPAGTVSSSAQISEFGYATTSSVSQSVSALNAATSSYITSAQTSSMTVLSASFAETASFVLGTVASASFAFTASEARNVVVIARNGNASSLPAGTLVHITGASGDNPIFNTASFNSELLSANTLGMLRTTAASGADVEVLVNGIVTGVNTDPSNGFVAGDILYLGPTGSFTRVQPQAPNQIVTIGQVLRAQQNNGSIYVNITNGWELDELHNVAINGVADGDLLVYRSASGLWTNSSSIELGNATTGSNIFVGNQTITGSVILSSSADVELQVIGNQSNTGSFLMSGSFRALVPQPTAIGITAPLFLMTGSLGQTLSQNIIRQGGGANDATLIQFQILSGSASTGDTLQALQTIGVTNNTSTFMTGSSVNSGITSLWATGSGGGRVAYTAAVSTTAQSGSAAATITANSIKLGSATANVIHITGSTQLFNTLQVRQAAVFSSSLAVSQSQVTLQNNGGIALSVISGSVEVTSPQGTGYFYSNLPITSSGLRINGTGLVSDLIISGVFSGNSSLQVLGNSSFTGSVFTSASVSGVVNPLTISSQTASLDFSKGNFFTIQLVSGSSTHINPTNIAAGQTVSLRLNTTGSGTVTFASSIKQASGSAYVPTTTTGVDVLTLITFDTSNVYISNLKNFS